MFGEREKVREMCKLIEAVRNLWKGKDGRGEKQSDAVATEPKDIQPPQRDEALWQQIDALTAETERACVSVKIEQERERKADEHMRGIVVHLVKKAKTPYDSSEDLFQKN